MSEVLVGTLTILGSLFVLLAAIGVVRMPDLYMRMSTVTKAATMGAGLLFVALVLHLPQLDVMARAAVILIFGFLTSPTTAHMMSRAAYFQGVPLWEGTLVDELKGHYSGRSHELTGPAAGEHFVAEALRNDDEL